MTTSIDKVEKLSDEELFKTLKGHGLNVGPITPTTRSLYEKRLKTFLESQSGGTAATVEATTGSNGNVTTTTSTQVPPSPSPKKSAPATPKASSESPRAAAMTQSLYEEATPRKSESPKMTSLSASYTTESSSDFPRIRGRAPLHRKADESTLSDESKEKKASSGSACYNFIKYLLLFVFVLVLVYFVVTMYEDKIQNVFDYIAF